VGEGARVGTLEREMKAREELAKFMVEFLEKQGVKVLNQDNLDSVIIDDCVDLIDLSKRILQLRHQR
jgi:hypothetical protein